MYKALSIKYKKNQVGSQKPAIRNSSGFTLIELLTVIAIISILTALLTVSYVSVRQRARDSQRKSDIKQIQSALELYRADNDQYPTTSSFPTCGNVFTGASGAVYMQKIPCDPQTGSGYFYNQTSATTYTLASCLENTNDPAGSSTQPTGMTACSSGKYFVNTNP